MEHRFVQVTWKGSGIRVWLNAANIVREDGGESPLRVQESPEEILAQLADEPTAAPSETRHPAPVGPRRGTTRRAPTYPVGRGR